jgi:hypothetical protein
MPINLHGYRPTDILAQNSVHHVTEVLMLTGFDALRSPEFWEIWAARQLGGQRTDHKGAVDVIVSIAGIVRRAEVKFSNAFFTQYKIHPRYSMKWAISAPQAAARSSDALILIGADIDGLIYSWVVPTVVIIEGRRSITITAPSSRSDNVLGRLDQWNAPPTELLPAFAAACRWSAGHAQGVRLGRSILRGMSDVDD